MAGLVSRQTSAGGGGLVYPLSVFTAEHLRRSGIGPGLSCVGHALTYSLLDQRARHGLREDGQRACERGTLLKENSYRQKGHARSLGLERQVESTFGQGSQTQRFHIKLLLAAFAEQEVGGHGVDLKDISKYFYFSFLFSLIVFIGFLLYYFLV